MENDEQLREYEVYVTAVVYVVAADEAEALSEALDRARHGSADYTIDYATDLGPAQE